MTVKAHEDKTFRGAFIASLTLPWGFAVNADEGGGGYHFVWARDLYHQVTGLLAAGDRAAGDRAVDWLFDAPAAARRDVPAELARGRDAGPAQHPARRDGVPDRARLPARAHRRPHLGGRAQGGRRARADGPVDAAGALGGDRRLLAVDDGGGDRRPGRRRARSPAGAATARAPRLWLGVADEWQRNTEEWMFTTTGPYGDGRYYLRINADTDPDDDDARDWGNAAGVHLEKEVVDAGFLELVRLGVKAPGDPYVADSLPETDASLATDTPSGRVWHRYTFDGYGEKDTRRAVDVQHRRAPRDARGRC